MGGDLAHYAQNNSGPGGLEPQIALGSTGRLALGAEGPLDWTVVGYMERCDLLGPGDDSEEQSFWREYLLYHRTAGFAFLVDAEDGWSWVRPMTGAGGHRPGRHGAGHGLHAALPLRCHGHLGAGRVLRRVQRDERAPT
ncbi:MAG: hypothetical protein U1F53_09090 [Burkholderiaceae bacterium]